MFPIRSWFAYAAVRIVEVQPDQHNENHTSTALGPLD